MADNSNHPQILIKRVKKAKHAGHHGGAWKVAYADFVTAMMAFFLLLWLLNATTEQQRIGISNYFAPGSVAKESSGAGGVLGGLSMNAKGAMSDSSPMHVSIPLPANATPNNTAGPNTDDTDFGDEGNKHTGDQKAGTLGAVKLTEAQRKQIAAEEQEKEFKKAEQELRQAIDSVPELKKLEKNLIIDRTPDGLRIQLIDQDGLEMFPLGSAEMYDYTRKLLAKVAEAVKLTKNRIEVTGHTDAHPYTRGGNYGNWELSADRANASRRALIDAGLSPDRIAKVVGKADTDPLLPKDPLNPRNRRISIVLLRNDVITTGIKVGDKGATSPAAAPAGAKPATATAATAVNPG